MKQYIALKDMPFWKEGRIRETTPQGFIKLEEVRLIYLEELHWLICNGWVKEWQEAPNPAWARVIYRYKWTDEDMLNFASGWHTHATWLEKYRKDNLLRRQDICSVQEYLSAFKNKEGKT